MNILTKKKIVSLTFFKTTLEVIQSTFRNSEMPVFKGEKFPKVRISPRLDSVQGDGSVYADISSFHVTVYAILKV